MKIKDHIIQKGGDFVLKIDNRQGEHKQSFRFLKNCARILDVGCG